MALILPEVTHIAAKDARIAEALRKLADAVNKLAVAAGVKL